MEKENKIKTIEQCAHDWIEYKQCCYCGGYENKDGKAVPALSESPVTAPSTSTPLKGDDWISVEDGGMIEGVEYLTYTPASENTIEGHRLLKYGSVASGFPSGVTHYQLPSSPKQ